MRAHLDLSTAYIMCQYKTVFKVSALYRGMYLVKNEWKFPKFTQLLTKYNPILFIFYFLERKHFSYYSICAETKLCIYYICNAM